MLTHLEISNKAQIQCQIKLANSIYDTHISNNVSIKLTSGPKRRINKVHGLHHAGTRNGNRRRPRPRDATPERVAARRAPPLHPPFGGEEAGGAKEGGYGGLRGLGPPWDKKVGFEALARGFACCLHITSKGEPPAYCLSLCRRSSGHGMLHISHMQRLRVLA